MARLYYSKLQAVLDADISAGATTVTFTAPLREWGEDNIATISSPDILAMWIGNELVHVTAYTSGASTATVLRGQEGSTATAHSEGDIFRNDATATDYELFSAGSPTETIQDIVGAMVTGGTETGIAVTYDDTNGRLDFVAEVTQTELDDVETDLAAAIAAGDASTLTSAQTYADGKVSDTAYDETSWNGVTGVAPSKNAVRDKFEALAAAVVTSVDGQTGAVDLSGVYTPKALTQNAQTGTTYTLVLTDAQKLVECSNASAITLTVPPNSSVAFPVGTQVHVLQTGAGQITVAPGGGVTVNGTPGLKARAQWSAITLIKRATDTWVAIGDLAA